LTIEADENYLADDTFYGVIAVENILKRIRYVDKQMRQTISSCSCERGIIYGEKDIHRLGPMRRERL